MAEAEVPFVLGVAGYRHFEDRVRAYRELDRIVADRGLPVRVVSGGAPGADALARDWAKERGIPMVEHLPKGSRAEDFKARNTLIAIDCTFLVAFLSDKSRGTHDTINKAAKMGKAVIIVHVD